MTFVTTLELESGDRRALESVVDEIRSAAERKGVQIKGPHTPPPEELALSIYEDLDGGQHAATWNYTVYSRTIEIVGHDEFAGSAATWDLPDQVHLEADVRSISQTG